MRQTVPFETPPASPYSHDELKRFSEDTHTLRLVATNAIAARAADILRTLAPRTDAPDRAALLDSLKEDLRRAASELEGSHVLRDACDLLMLWRVCRHAACRRTQRCAGDARCVRGVAAPEPVLDRVAWMLIAERVPWISGRAEEKLAYECWVAGIEAGLDRPRVPAKAGTQGQKKKELDSRVRGNERR